MRPLVHMTALRDAQALESRLTVLERENAALRGLSGSFALRIDRHAGSEAIQSARNLLQTEDVPGGQALEVRLYLDDALAQRLARVDGEIVGRKLLAAAEKTLTRSLEGHQGVVALRFEEADSYNRPVVQVLLSAKRTDGTPTLFPALQVRVALEQEWRHETYRTFGLRIPIPAREADRLIRGLEARWRDASRQLQEAYRARVFDRLSQAEFAHVFMKARDAYEAYTTALRPQIVSQQAPVRFEPLHVRLERGGEALRSLSATERDTLLQRAIREVAAPATAAPQVLTHPAGKDGRDLGMILYLGPGAANQNDLKGRLEASLADAVTREVAARGLPPATDLAARASTRGFLEKGAEREAPLRSAVVSEHAPMAPPPSASPAPRAESLGWMDDRLTSVVVRVRGTEPLGRLTPEVQQRILQRAVDRAWPGFQEAKIRGNFLVELRGSELRVKILVPDRQREAQGVLQRPLTQARITNEIHRGIAEHMGDRPAERTVLRCEQDAERRLTESPYRDPRVPFPASPQPPLERAERVTIRVVEERFRLGNGQVVRANTAVHRIEGGADYLARFGPTERRQILHAALWDTHQGRRPAFGKSHDLARPTYSFEVFKGRDLELHVLAGGYPPGWWERKAMEHPNTARMFSDALSQAVAGHEGRPLLPRPQRDRSISRLTSLLNTPLRTLQHARTFVESPIRSPAQLAKDLLLSRAIPAPMRPITRSLVRLIPRGDE